MRGRTWAAADAFVINCHCQESRARTVGFPYNPASSVGERVCDHDVILLPIPRARASSCKHSIWQTGFTPVRDYVWQTGFTPVRDYVWQTGFTPVRDHVWQTGLMPARDRV
jgi:hypothetical protein